MIRKRLIVNLIPSCLYTDERLYFQEGGNDGNGCDNGEKEEAEFKVTLNERGLVRELYRRGEVVSGGERQQRAVELKSLENELIKNVPPLL